MKKATAYKLADGTLIKRKERSRTWFKVITKGPYGVVATSTTKGSDYSIILKNKAVVFIAK